jgi:phosphoribosyl 1,2-cyclic phosphodiesterase
MQIILCHPSKNQSEQMLIEFWGVRGTLPVPGKKTQHYGGNTNCLSLRFPNQHFFIFDAGTGMKELSNYLLSENKFPLNAKIFISHPHYDHINGIPFFAPLYIKGNKFEFLGTNQKTITLENIISDQMNGIYFPVTIDKFAAQVNFHQLQEETFFIDDIKIQTILLNHPGRCLGFKVEYQDKVFCYITDNEFYLEDSPHYSAEALNKFIRFIENTDVLVIDSTYLDEEYQRKTGWGHSSITRVVEVAHQAKIKLLCLYHHDPDQFDKEIDLKLERAITLLREFHSNTRCIAPSEGDQIFL